MADCGRKWQLVRERSVASSDQNEGFRMEFICCSNLVPWLDRFQCLPCYAVSSNPFMSLLSSCTTADIRSATLVPHKIDRVFIPYCAFNTTFLHKRYLKYLFASGVLPWISLSRNFTGRHAPSRCRKVNLIIRRVSLMRVKMHT
jgi:hypothetical protein